MHYFVLLFIVITGAHSHASTERNHFFQHEIKNLISDLPQSLQAHCQEDIKEAVQYAMESGDEVSKSVLWDKQTVLLNGPVTLEYLWLLENLKPEIQTIALEVPHGGHAIASFLIAKKIRELQLDTFVGLTWCHSACTIMFQGGAHRIIDPKGLLTYHGVRLGTNNDSKQCLEEINFYMKQTLIALDFPKEHLIWFRSPAIINPEGANSLLDKGISTKIERKIIGNDQSILERAAKPDYCDRHPEDEEC